jgi:hypothetical protein
LGDLAGFTFYIYKALLPGEERLLLLRQAPPHKAFVPLFSENSEHPIVPDEQYRAMCVIA